MSCNCPHCRRKGFLLDCVPIDRFRLTSGTGKLKTYQFHKHNIDHQFCTDCGCQGFAIGTGPDGAKMVAVNLRCVPDADLDISEEHTSELQSLMRLSYAALCLQKKN